MKKKLFFIQVLITIGMFKCFDLIGTVHAQTAIPNGGFENWTSNSYGYPQGYPNTSNSQNFFKDNLAANVTETTDAYHGYYAAQVVTNASATDTAFGYFLNINPNNNGDPSSWTGGMAYNQMPTGIRGWYKYNVATADSGTIIVDFSKAGVNIGSYIYEIGGVHSTYTLFNFTFSPALTQTPDSVAFGVLSCKFNPITQQPSGIPGDTLKIDSVSFTGVGSQPAMMYGDFENWPTVDINIPNSWYVEDDNGQGFNRTNDAYSGNYALELTTYLGNHNNMPGAQGGQVSTGYYPNNCDSGCYEMGGYPFANQIDTLVFYYKYVPSGNDSASVQLNFKKNGSMINGPPTIFLNASPTYQYMMFPISLNSTPDSVMIDIQSSNYNDSALSFIGSDLKIDAIQFKSQPLNTGIKLIGSTIHAPALYPNPFSTTATLDIDPQTDLQGMQLHLYDMLGRTVKTMAVQQYKTTIAKDDLCAGIYFYEVKNNYGILKTGKIIIE